MLKGAVENYKQKNKKFKGESKGRMKKLMKGVISRFPLFLWSMLKSDFRECLRLSWWAQKARFSRIRTRRKGRIREYKK